MSIERIKLGLKQQKTFMRRIIKGNIPDNDDLRSCIATMDDILYDIEQLLNEKVLNHEGHEEHED